MLNSLRNLLYPKPDAKKEENQLDVVINDLTTSIESVKIQHTKILNQERGILQKLDGYELQLKTN